MLKTAHTFNQIIRTLLVSAITVLFSYQAFAELGEPEKDELTFGFIKLTDMAPIAIAYENGSFAAIA